MWTSVSGISLAAGPVLGGLLVALAGWRGIFWFNVGFGLLALAAAAWTLPESSDPQGRKLDVPGLVTGVVAVSALTFAVIEGETAGFSSWWIELLFVARGRRRRPLRPVERQSGDPVVRLDYFRIPAYSSANAVAFATSFGLFAVFFFTALYLQIEAKFSGGKIALQFVAMAIAMVVAGPGRRCLDGGARAARADGARLPARRGRDVPRRRAPLAERRPLGALGRARVVGFGLGLALVAVTASVLAIVPAERSGMAASTVNTSRELGGVLAVAILGAVINGRLVSDLTAHLGGLGVSHDLQQLVVHAVTHGGLPANAALAMLANPVVAAEALTNPGILGKILDAAEASFGNALHAGLTVAALILLAGAGVVAVRLARLPEARLGRRGRHAAHGLLEERARGAEVEPSEAPPVLRPNVGPGG